MRIAICSAGYAGYSCACWRALVARLGYDCTIYSLPTEFPYKDVIRAGLPLHIISPETAVELRVFQAEIIALHPDIIVIPGWGVPAFTSLLKIPALHSARFLMAIDTDWRGTWRHRLARFALRSILKRLDGMIVAGERGRQFALACGFPPEKIFTSIYGCDYTRFHMVAKERGTDPSVFRSFVYVGRYALVKGCDTLLKAYQIYRQAISEPWPLHCYGNGLLRPMLVEALGGNVHDFVQPDVLPATLARHGVYILPSHHEPWGVSLAEAAATGMPVICSDAVTSGVDLVRHLYDGLVFPSGHPEDLARCLVWAHRHEALLPEMGHRAAVYAGAYSAETWANRWMWTFEKVVGK